jgi:hypothetical protein
MVKKVKYNTVIFLIFSISLSCEFPFDNRNNFIPIDSNCELDILVESTTDSRGIIINNKYYYGGGIYLQYNNDYPKWLLEKNDIIDLPRPFDKDSSLNLDIWHIKIPYRIYKKANSNVLFLIKNNGTLKFKTL